MKLLFYDRIPVSDSAPENRSFFGPAGPFEKDSNNTLNHGGGERYVLVSSLVHKLVPYGS